MASPKPHCAVQTPSTLCGLVNQIFALSATLDVGNQVNGHHRRCRVCSMERSGNPLKTYLDLPPASTSHVDTHRADFLFSTPDFTHHVIVK